ncbi:hypothetical protein AB0P21_24710 [Kribbella sp. NPDC056861]|uniref:hypothetical protein n=1 Tax=Kribbella sp. NPDC056861 TaxID=3154857 RepID=UPI00342306FD
MAKEPERTPDGRYIVIGGRRWRATDPAIPAEVQSQLRSLLMRARRAVKQALHDEDPAAEKRARAQVQTAKVALGERGDPWWDQTDQERERRWTDGVQQLTETE